MAGVRFAIAGQLASFPFEAALFGCVEEGAVH
jgi:hypothetical protein